LRVEFVSFVRQFVTDTGIQLVPIPAGSFTMGSPATESGQHAMEGPQTQVTLTKDFLLGSTDVTQGQYEALMGSNPSGFKDVGRDGPVENVSWDDAMGFCQKLNEREAGRLPAGYSFTLPTEAQWEYACRAGTTGPYAGDVDTMAWNSSNSGGKTHPVGQKRANAWGLFDMHGNVWQWCLDFADGRYPGGSVTDPTGPASAPARVARGGVWKLDATHCRSAERNDPMPYRRSNQVGFRLAPPPCRSPQIAPTARPSPRHSLVAVFAPGQRGATALTRALQSGSVRVKN
jgi:formylglycine-generating enzyme required for sulfatase activity